MYIIISYDITDDSRRAKIFAALKDYGAWVQYSVFECKLNKIQYLLLRHRLKKLLRGDPADSIGFYILCEKCQRKIKCIGGVVVEEKNVVIV